LTERKITVMETQHGNFTKADADALLSRLKQFADSLPAGEREALKHMIITPARRYAMIIIDGQETGGSLGWDSYDWFRFIVEHLFD
jgi:hypothetical protein